MSHGTNQSFNLRRAVAVAVTSMLIGSTAGAAGAADDAYDIHFVDVTRRAGLIDPLAGMMGHGGAWGDYDGDGRLDLFVGGFCDRPTGEYAPAPGPVPTKLLRNVGDGRFVPADQPAVQFYARTSGAVFADLNNDGMLELYTANNARSSTRKSDEPQRSAQLRHSHLFSNTTGRMADISDASGACPSALRSARNIGVLDYNGDGLLDLLIVEDRFIRDPRTTLLKNLGGLKFADANKSAGLPDDLFGLGLAVADLNDDGRPDFFVAHSNRLFMSQRNGTYREAVELRDLFTWKPVDAEDWPCGAVFGDLNRDGRPDLVLSIHFKSARNRVFINQGLIDGVPRFADVTAKVGLGAAVPIKCPHVEIQDFDNDGWPDIYMSAAWRDDRGVVTPLVYQNRGVAGDGLPRFVAPRAIEGPMVYYPAGPTGDYDNDGRVDVFLVNWFAGDHCHLLRNDSPRRHWLDVRVQGRTINRMGIGSKISVYKTGRLGDATALLGHQELNVGYGYASGQAAICHFGLGDGERVDLRIALANGQVIERRGVAADQTLLVQEP